MHKGEHKLEGIRLHPLPTLITTTLLLAGIGIAVQCVRFQLGIPTAKGLVPLFDLNGEANIPTFFSSFLLSIAAYLLWLISRAEPRRRRHWGALALGILLMAMDEIAQIHENLNTPAQALTGKIATGTFRNSWIIFGLFFAVMMLLVFRRFLARLPANSRLRFNWAGLIYLSGSIGMESTNGPVLETWGDSLAFNLTLAFEESLEMAGVLLLIRALILHLAEQHPQIRLVFGPPAAWQSGCGD